jgi:hypothetical protein
MVRPLSCVMDWPISMNHALPTCALLGGSNTTAPPGASAQSHRRRRNHYRLWKRNVRQRRMGASERPGAQLEAQLKRSPSLVIIVNKVSYDIVPSQTIAKNSFNASSSLRIFPSILQYSLTPSPTDQMPFSNYEFP